MTITEYPLTFYLPVVDRQVERMLHDLGHRTVSERDKGYDIVMFVGGEDVFPLQYGEPTHKSTFFSLTRDRTDNHAFHRDPIMFPRVGICRGAQFLCVKSGGKLWQDVDGHATGYNHLVTLTENGAQFFVSSTHHQMMIPTDDAWVLATASASTKKSSAFNTKKLQPDHHSDVEVAYFWNTNSLCFQFHPEYYTPNKIEDSDMTMYFNKLIDEHYGSEIYRAREKNKKETK